MKAILNRFTEKQFVQNILIEVVADSLMVIIGFIVAYYVRISLI